jgi:CHRD domain
MRGRLLLGLFVLGLVGVTVAAAGINRNWSVHANGSQEVPVRDTQGQGQAIFHLSKDGSSLDYKLIASNIENVFMAHIHQQAPGVNGPIVVWLYPSTAVAPGPVGAGRTDGVLVEGTITAANIAPTAPAGYTFAQLLEDMRGGNAYVNLHTNDGVAPDNTGAGDFPGGEIRADIR